MKKKTGQENAEKISSERLNDFSVQSENPAFAPGELVACAACARANPPTRSKCLYCGAALPVSGGESKFFRPDLRKLEAWEKGFNVVFTGASAAADDAELAQISLFLKLEKEVLREILTAENSLPLARVETAEEAEIIQKRLRDSALETKILADADLKPEQPPRRLRAMEFRDDRLVMILFNADEIAEIKWENVTLIVAGALFERKVEMTETRRKKGASKLLDSNETASDAILFDIYGADDFIGYTVAQTGFDFSCLGAEKSLLAAENIKRLIAELSKRAPNAKIVDDYLKIRAGLGAVWQVEEHTDSQGLKRESFGNFNLGNVTTINNAAQFTKYSRLQRHSR